VTVWSSLYHTQVLQMCAIMWLSAEQQVLEAQLEQLQQQRTTMEGELQSLSSSFHATTLDNQNLHQHIQVCRRFMHGCVRSRGCPASMCALPGLKCACSTAANLKLCR
jgi:hypothetical protein